MYYVGFSTATIIASIILFQGLNTDDPANSISLLAGFITTFLGVHLLELSRSPGRDEGGLRGDGYVRARRGAGEEEGEAVGLETMYEPEPDDYEDLADERTALHRAAERSPRSSRERERERERDGRRT